MSTLVGLTWKPLVIAIPLYLLSSQTTYVDAKATLIDIIAKIGLSTSLSKSILRTLLGLSLASSLNNYLNQRSSGRGLLGKRDSYDWSREVVVVTGASSGIGHLVARTLAGRGVKTIVLDVNPPKENIGELEALS
jgi:NADPH:quinone reductase-like Zn-dependent oxidoreductase